MTKFMVNGDFGTRDGNSPPFNVRVVVSVPSSFQFSSQEFARWKSDFIRYARDLQRSTTMPTSAEAGVEVFVRNLAGSNHRCGVRLANAGATPAVQISIIDCDDPVKGTWIGAKMGGGRHPTLVDVKKREYKTALPQQAGREGLLSVVTPSRDDQLFRGGAIPHAL